MALIDLTAKVTGSPPFARLDAVEDIFSDWGIGKWVDAVVPNGYFTYFPLMIKSPTSERYLMEGESNTQWAVKIVLASLDLTAENETFPADRTPRTKPEKDQAKWRGFAALMSRIGRLEKVFKLNAHYAQQMRMGLG